MSKVHCILFLSVVCCFTPCSKILLSYEDVIMHIYIIILLIECDLLKAPFEDIIRNYGDVIFVSEGLKNWTQFYFGLLQIKFIVLFFNAMN